MKKILFLFTLLLPVFLFGRNVGIDTNAPSPKLDVNGNLNVSGNIQVNNTAGQPNQVLMTNSTGDTVGTDCCEFKNFICFQFPGYFNWIVPADITRIMVELWGAGGGGAAGGGGGSGAYVRSIMTVVPGQVFTLGIGNGGAGAVNNVTNAGNGGNTSFGVIIFAPGGGGATPITPGEGATNLFSIFYLNGNNGMPTTETYAQRTSTEWATIRKYGDGGKAVLINGNEGTGSTFSFNTNTLANISLIKSLEGKAAGAGGGGGPNKGTSWGSAGANGMMVIHY